MTPNALHRDLISLLDDAAFRELSNAQRRFNLFEATGMIRQEIRHSRLLAYLLDPSRPHGLDDAFLRQFLLTVVEASEAADTSTAITFRLEEFNNVEVLTEWNHIDLLVVDRQRRWILLVENKLFSTEHSNQLTRYYELIQTQFPGFNILAVFLTLDGDDPSDTRFISIGYEQVLDALTEAAARQSDQVPRKVQDVIHDYQTLVREKLMSESDVAELCRKIYARHKEAIDLLVQHIPSHKDDLREQMETILNGAIKSEGWIADRHQANVMRFVPPALDIAGLSRTPIDVWTRTGRTLIFELRIGKRGVNALLLMGPCDREFRERVFAWAKGVADKDGLINSRLGQSVSGKHQRLVTLQLAPFNQGDLENPDAIDAISADLRRTVQAELIPHVRGVTRLIEESDWYQELEQRQLNE